MDIEDWKSQLKRGTLEYSILLLIRKKESYGYEIIQNISQYETLRAKESTIYPLLRRLSKDGFLESYWKDSYEGVPPRKYYKITDKGNQYLELMTHEWEQLVKAMTTLQ